MSNPFDQFDALDATNANSVNPFDQFDSANAKTTTDRPSATLLDTAQQGYSGMKAAEMLDLNRQYRTAIPELEKSAAEAGPLTKWAYDMQLDRNKRGLQETQDYLNQYSEAQKVAPVNPTLDKIQQAKTFDDVWSAVKENPVDAITHGVASSAVPSALMLGNAYLGGRVGGLPGASIAGGATSADVEYKSGVVEGLNQAGINVGDRHALDVALDDTSLMNQIDLQAGQKAAVVGTLDAASLGVAGKLFPHSALKAAAANAVVQPALGAGGEAGGAIYSGQEVKPGAVALEALGELPSSVAEVALARNARKESKPNQESTESTQNIYADQSPPPQPSGLDMNAVVDRMIGAESAGKADAKNPLSSAEGLGQFIDSTWLKMVKKHRPDVANGKSDQDILDLKTNGALSREMTTRYAEDNMQELQSSGFEATGRNVYLAHHFGVGGARSLLRADPNVPVASVVSAQVIQQNPYMRGKTVGQVLDFIGNKMGEQAGSVSSASISSTTGAPTSSFINSAQNTTETSQPESSTPTSLTDAINPALQAGTEAMQAAQAPMDSPTAPSPSDNLVETVQNVAAKPIEPTTVEAAQTEVAPTPSAEPTSEVQPVPVVNELAPLTDLNQAQAVPIEPAKPIEPVEATPASVAVDEPKLFSVATDEAEQFRASLDKALSDRRSVDVPIALGKPSRVLQAVGVPDLPVVVTRDTIRKASNEVKHNVPVEVIRQLPELMADPIMVFDSADAKAGGSVVLVEATDKDNRSVMVAVHVNKQKGFSQVNQIASIYGRERDGDFVRWMNEGRLRYMHQQKSQQWSLSRGLQLPKEIGTAGGKTTILTNEDIVKRSQQSPSTGRTRSGLSVSEVQAELAAKLGDARVKRLLMLGKLVFADNPPAESVQGSYQNGVVTLYPDNIPQGEAWGVFLHEAGEHAALEKMLGAEKYALVMSSFDKLVKSGNADALRAVERVPGDTPQQHVAAERLAYLIEDFTNNTLKTGGAKNLVRRLIAALRAWAFDKLPAWARPQELSVVDIQALAVRAARGWVSSITSENGNNTQAVEKQEVANESGTSGDALYSFGEKIAKQLYDPDQVVRQKGVVSFVKRMVDGNYGSVHQVIRSINTPTARELADIFEVHANPDVRTNDYYIHDFHTDVSKGIGKYNTQLNAILKPLRKGRLDRVSKADGYALVRGLHTGIVPDHLVDTALALRKFLDELRDYQQAAGLSLDYLRHYFPRVYDVSKVLNQQEAFTEVLEKHGLSKNRARDVINKIVNGDGLVEADKADDSERITPEEADAVPDVLELTSPEEADGKEKNKEKNLRRRLSRVNGVEGSAGKAKHQKHRSLNKIPYADLEPFLNNNLEEILVRYVSAAVRKAEYARRFGEREQQLNQMVAKIVKELQAGERINSGSFADAWKNMGGRTTGEAVRFIYSAADALQGKYKPIENDTARNANTVVSNTITQLLLPLAALSSLVEFVTSPIRGQSFRSSSVGLMHGVAYALKRAVDSAGLIVTGRHLIKSDGHYAELAEQLGIVTQDALMERLAEQAAFAGGNNKLANLSNWSTQKFMTYTLQEPIMKMQKVAALATYHRVVRKWAKTTDKPVSVRKLREFGIDPVQAKEWAEGGFKENSPAMFAINAGSIRFVNSVVTTPTSTNRPLWTQDPHFRLFYQFSTFQKVFTNTLYRYILTNLFNSKVTKVEKLRIVATMALMMGVAMAAQALRDWWKYGDERKEKTGAEWAGIGVDRPGFTGNFAPIYEFFWPYRHGYYDNAAVRAASLFGPAFSTLVKNMDAFSISEKTGTVNAKKAARQLVNDIPYVNALPRKGQLSAPRKALEGSIEESLR